MYGTPAMDLTESIATIATRSKFDRVQFTGSHYEGRFGTVYEALVSRAGGQDDVAIRLLDQPGAESDWPAFRDQISTVLNRWSRVSDDEGILTVHDTGIEPSPWVVTQAAAGTLEDRDPMDFVDLGETALALADSVMQMHNREVIHAGLDPDCIAVPGSLYDDVVQETPLLDNVGMILVYRYFFEPATYLDPRYAAPEYYSTKFGSVDHMTDIYQLGAVLYRLFTGRHPYTGSFEQIRESVLSREPPTPSEAGGPEPLDRIVASAMAKEKLKRYETIEHLRQDLELLAANR